MAYAVFLKSSRNNRRVQLWLRVRDNRGQGLGLEEPGGGRSSPSPSTGASSVGKCVEAQAF